MFLSNKIVFLIEESVESGFEARALGHSIFTEGETLEEVKEAAIDAVKCHFDNQAPRVALRYL